MPAADHVARAPRQSGERWLEKAVIGHFAALLLFTTWAFGGQAPWAREVIAWWGAGGVILLGVSRWRLGGARVPALRWLWPLWLYDLLVAVSCFNPSFREVLSAGERTLVMADPRAWLPSAALPSLAARELWTLNVLVISSFNLLLLPGRRLIRGILFLMVTNAVVLAVFGTFQKLVGAKGLWFGLVPSPNPRFFATFVYYNHWGAFTLLNLAACIALLFQAYRHHAHRDIWHSPVPLGAVITLLLAASVPLSASRSSTILAGLLLLLAVVYLLWRLLRRARAERTPVLGPALGLVLAVGLAAGAIGYLARGSITERVRQTSAQLSAQAPQDALASRLTLYRDTWRMAAEKPWFGWGLESYAHVFRIFNTQRAVEQWVWIPFYAEAHNDWLQSLAETGFVGTGLLVLLGLLPLWTIPWRRIDSNLPRWLLAGCAFVLLYAWVEFPFANPAVILTFWATFYCALRYAALDLEGQRESAR
jgi:O-antigen ligase